MQSSPIPKLGNSAKIKALKNWGAVREGEVLNGVWKQSTRPDQLRLDLVDLPNMTAHPTIFMSKETGACIIKNFKLID